MRARPLHAGPFAVSSEAAPDRLLGHSKIGTTMDLYSHVAPTMQHEATLAMEAILHG